MTTIRIKVENPNSILPKKAHPDDAAFDLAIPDHYVVKAKSRHLIPLGYCIGLPKGFCAKVRPRSGFSSKGIEGVRSLGNETARYDADILPGLIDCGYTGQIGVTLHNHENFDFIIPRGTRVAQMMIERVDECEFVTVESLDDSERGDRGFGSTGAV